MNYLFEKSRYPHNTIRYKLEKIETELKKLGSANKKEELSQFAVKASQLLDIYRSQLKGINQWFFALGVIAVHTTLLFKRRVMLYELPIRSYYLHLALLAGAGLASGLLVGSIYGKDIKAFRKVNRLQKELDSIKK
jgi:DNA-binding ferritin-like protein (Dps family)